MSPKAIVALRRLVSSRLCTCEDLVRVVSLQNLRLPVPKVAAILLFLALGFRSGARNAVASDESGGATTLQGDALALVPVMFTYSGWNAAAYVAEEIHARAQRADRAGLGARRGRDFTWVERAVSLRACPASLASVPGTLIDTVAGTSFGFVAGNLIALFTIVSIAASISAMVLAGPRVCFAMARDGVFAACPPRACIRAFMAGRRHRGAGGVERRVGAVRIVVAAGELHRICRGAVLGIAVAALFTLRMREPRAAIPRAGYPLAPAIFVMASAVIVLNELWQNPRPTLAGLAIILVGVRSAWMRRR